MEARRPLRRLLQSHLPRSRVRCRARSTEFDPGREPASPPAIGLGTALARGRSGGLPPRSPRARLHRLRRLNRKRQRWRWQGPPPPPPQPAAACPRSAARACHIPAWSEDRILWVRPSPWLESAHLGQGHGLRQQELGSYESNSDTAAG